MNDQRDVDRLALRTWRQLMKRLLEFEAEGHPVDPVYAGQILKDYTEVAERLGEPVNLPAGFARLCAQALTGELPKRRGRRVHFDSSGNSWLLIQVARAEFQRRRPYEGYTAVVDDIAATCCVSEKVVEEWVRGLSLPKPRK